MRKAVIVALIVTRCPHGRRRGLRRRLYLAGSTLARVWRWITLGIAGQYAWPMLGVRFLPGVPRAP